MDSLTFPWPIIPAIACFGVGFVVQFRLKHYVDREKVLSLKNLSELFPNSVPPKKILNEKGKKLYTWFYIGIFGFIFFAILTAVLYGK